MVARFVGSPQMNLFAGKVDDNGAVLQGDGMRLNLAGLLQEAPVRLAGRSLTLGVRPEEFRAVEDGQGWIGGEIDLVEDLGSDRFLHVKFNGIEVVARDGRERSLRPGDRIGLHVDRERVHLFLDGKRIDP
jgi:ABC-type sugar transport system ATPase subunit